LTPVVRIKAVERLSNLAEVFKEGGLAVNIDGRADLLSDYRYRHVLRVELTLFVVKMVHIGA
jgi:hypothetical protein